MKFKNFIISLSVVILTFSLAGCAVNPVTGEKEFMLLSESQEIQMGKEAFPSLIWSGGGEYKEQKLKSYLNGIVSRMWSISQRANLSYSFFIQNSSIPNAFAIPGYVCITRGLLVELENEAQLSAVMGHEIGHVMARHSAKRMSLGIIQQLGGAAAASLVQSKGEGTQMLLGLGMLGSNLLLLKYDRNQEIQADKLGVAYMSKIGYDPYQAVAAHERLEGAVNKYLQTIGKNKGESSFLDDMVSTHPRKEVRVDEIKQMIKSLGYYNVIGDGKNQYRFQNLLQGLKKTHQAYLVYDDAEREYNKGNLERAEALAKRAVSMESNQPPFYNLIGLIKAKNNSFYEAKSYFQKALNIDYDYQPAYYGLGVTYFVQNDYNSALKYTQESLKRFPQHLGSNYISGMSYFNIKNYRNAVSPLRTFAESFPKHPEVHGILGICYEKTGDYQLAAEQYYAQLQAAPSSKMGIYSKERLNSLQPYIQQNQNKKR